MLLLWAYWNCCNCEPIRCIVYKNVSAIDDIVFKPFTFQTLILKQMHQPTHTLIMLHYMHAPP